MRVSGLTVEQVAERLGVTKAHLYQELGRHPQTERQPEHEGDRHSHQQHGHHYDQGV